jgi:hypothetical protein
VVRDDRHLSEQAASELVGAVLGVPIRELDGPTAPPGTPDFEMILAGGTVPLEVTRSTDRYHRSFWNATSKADWELPGLSFSWRISTGYQYPRVKEVRRSLERVLPLLEAAGITEFDTNDPDANGNRPDRDAPWFPLVAVGVRRGSVVAMEQHPPTVMVGTAGSFATGPEVVNDLVKKEFANNARKVGRGGHLFVWVDLLDHRTWMALDLDAPPRKEPDLPSGVTAWVARQKRGGEWIADRLWRGGLTGWESVTSLLG